MIDATETTDRKNMKIGEWLDKKIQEGKLDNLLLKRSSALQLQLNEALEEIERLQKENQEIEKRITKQFCDAQVNSDNKNHNLKQLIAELTNSLSELYEEFAPEELYNHYRDCDLRKHRRDTTVNYVCNCEYTKKYKRAHILIEKAREVIK